MLSESDPGLSSGENEQPLEKSGSLESLLRNASAEYLPETLAPPVDKERLRALARRQLSPERAQIIYELCASFRSWNEAYTRALFEEQQSDVSDE